jgi:predicted acetyltransferase
MLRLVDVKGALEAVPVSPQARGEIVIEVADDVLPANARAWRVTAKDCWLKVTPERTSSRALPRLTAPVDALATIVAGTLSPVAAAECGMVESQRGAAELAEAWFRARPVYLYPMNAF